MARVVISELILGGEIMKSLSAEVLPGGSGPSAGNAKGTIVIRTVRGDVHDVGKDFVGPSGLLTLAFMAMKSTVEGIAAAGFRDEVKIMIGGAAVSEHVRAYAGADGWDDDAGHAVKLDEEWTNGDD